MAVDTASQIIAVKSPDFASDSRLTDFIALAANHVSKLAYGSKYQYALALVVLHWLTLDAQRGGTSTSSGTGVGGSISSEKEGDLARSFSVPSSSKMRAGDAYWSATMFGQELLNLRAGCILTPHTRLSLGVTRAG